MIRRLDGTTWTKIFPRLSSSSTEKADTKVVGDKTYILLFNGTNSNLVTVTYDPGPPKIYSNPVTQSITLVGSSIETATIDIDGTGRMWLAYEGSNNINVMWSNSPSYSTWSSAIVLESGVDSDDICLLNRFEKQVIYLENHFEIGILGTNYFTFVDDPEKLEKVYMKETAKKMIKDGLCPVHNATCMIRKSIINKYGKFDPAFNFGAEDQEMYTRFFCEGVEIKNLKQGLLYLMG